MVRSDLLAPWTRWLTPDFEPRRFDTYFFLARLPADQRTRDVGGEAEHTLWARPDELGDLPMLPPTARNLADLAAFRSADEAVAAAGSRRLTRPVHPRIVSDGNGTWLTLDTAPPDDEARLATNPTGTEPTGTKADRPEAD